MDKVKIRMIISNIFFGLLFIPSLFLAAISGMMFDAPGSENIYTLLFFSSVLSFPLLIILSIPSTWIFYELKKYKISFFVSLLPFLSIFLFILSFFLIVIVCDGNFGC